jgi:hypothetical protein
LPLSDDYTIIRENASGWVAAHKDLPGYLGYGLTPGAARDDLWRRVLARIADA